MAAAVVPAFRAVPCGTYVRMHQSLDRYIERYMPPPPGEKTRLLLRWP